MYFIFIQVNLDLWCERQKNLWKWEMWTPPDPLCSEHERLEIPVENVKFEFRINRLVILALYSTFTDSGLKDTSPSRLEKPGIEQRSSQLVGDPLYLLSRIHSESSKIRNISQTVGRGWNEAVRHAEWWAVPEFCSSSTADLHRCHCRRVSRSHLDPLRTLSHTSFTSRRHRLKKDWRRGEIVAASFCLSSCFCLNPLKGLPVFHLFVWFISFWYDPDFGPDVFLTCLSVLHSALSQVQVPVGGLGLRVIHPHKQTAPRHQSPRHELLWLKVWGQTGPLTVGWIQKTVSDRRSDVRKKKADSSAELRRRFFRDVIRGKKLSSEESAPAIVTAGVLKLGAHREMQACLGFPD